MKKSYLSIDYGRARIGLAISESGLIAIPFKTIENKGERKNLAAISEIIKQKNIGTIVIGVPVHKNATMSDEIYAFAKTFGNLGAEIVFQNEMLSSVEAEEILRLNNKGSFDKKLIDSVAASVVLNAYLKEKIKNGLQN